MALGLKIQNHIVDEWEKFKNQKGWAILPYESTDTGVAPDLAGYHPYGALIAWQETGDQRFKDFAMAHIKAIPQAYQTGYKQFNQSHNMRVMAAEALLSGIPWRGGGSILPPPSGNLPTLSLSASPTSITSGQSSTLTWSSTNATSCSALWTSSTAASGSQPVTPTVTTTYTLTCTGSGGIITRSATVSVTIPPKFKIGDRVKTTGATEIKSEPYIDGTFVGTQSTGSLGTVIGDPYLRANGINAWNIDFDIAPDGWAAENYLVLSSATPPPPGAPTLSLFASPTSITSGGSSTLSWSSTNTSSCSAGGAWTGSKSTSGSQVVTPTVTSTYSLTCTGSGGSASQSTTVTVTTTPPPTTAKFKAGDRVQTTDNLNVRASAGADSLLLGTQPTGSLGTVVTGPTVTPLYTWWNVDFDNAPDGWVIENYLVLSSATPPPPPPGVPSVTISAYPTSINTGQSSTLSWSSVNTTSCSASGSWNGDRPLSGTQVVTPTITSNYIITCLGGGTSTGDLVTVTVTSTPTPPPPSSGISIGDWIQVTEKVSVRYLPATDSKRLGVQYVGTKGKVIGGPAQGSGYTWWNIDYTVVPDGWSVENYITETTAPSPVAIGSRVTTTDNIKVRSAPNGERIGRQPAGSQGTITAGPIQSGGYTWWNVNFDSGTDGWAAGSYLAGQ